MSTPKPPAPTLCIPDAELWGDPLAAHYEAAFDECLESQFDGLLLAAPTEVPLDARDSLPLIVLHGGSLRELRRLGFDRHAILVSVDLDRNEVRAGRAIELPPASASGEPQPPKGYGLAPSRVDVRDRLSLPWLPAKLLLRVLMRDRVSGPLEIRLGKSGEAYEDPEVAAYIARQRARQQPSSVSPHEGEGHRARYHAHALPGGPALPDRAGLAITLPRVIPLEAGATCTLRAAARVAPLAQERIEVLDPPTFPTGMLEPAPEDKTSPRREPPHALVAITLVVIAADQGIEITEQLRVPAWSCEGEEVATHFELDLFALFPDIRRQPAQTWFAYAFCGPHMAGATPFALLPLELL